MNKMPTFREQLKQQRNDQLDELIQILDQNKDKPEKWDVATKAKFYYAIRDALRIAKSLKKLSKY